MSGIGAAIAGGAASGAVSTIGGKLFGGDRPRVGSAIPREVNLPGLQLRRSGGGFNFNRTAGVQSTLDEVRQLGARRAGEIRSLAGEVRPGFGRLTEARTEALGANRRRTIGNLREQLQRRRVLGSSFGADTISRAESEFAMQEDQIRAESFLQEIETQNQLLNQAFEAEASGALTELQQLGLETQVAANLTQSLVSARNNVNIANAEIQNAAREGRLDFINTIAGTVLKQFIGGEE